MAQVSQIPGVVKSIAKQLLGADIETVSTKEWISIGNDQLSTPEKTSHYASALVSTIAETVISTRAYEANSIIRKDVHEYGLQIRKIYTDPQKTINDIENNAAYELQNGVPVEQYTVRLPDTRSKVFAKAASFQIPITIQEDELKMSFSGPETWGAYIASIFEMVANVLQIVQEGMDNIAISTLAAYCVNQAGKEDNEAIVYKNILDIYNTRTNAGLTEETAREDKKFLRFFNRTLIGDARRLVKPSTLYNSEGWTRHTPKDYQRVLVLDSFELDSLMNMESDTFHNELVAMPGHYSIPYWQNAEPDLDSAINITLPDDDETAVNTDGVVAMVFDLEAVGSNIYLEKVTTSPYNANGDFYNYFYKFTKSYYVDPSEQCIVYAIKEV